MGCYSKLFSPFVQFLDRKKNVSDDWLNRKQNRNCKQNSKTRDEAKKIFVFSVYSKIFHSCYHATLFHRSILIYVRGFYSAWRETYKHHVGRFRLAKPSCVINTLARTLKLAKPWNKLHEKLEAILKPLQRGEAASLLLVQVREHQDIFIPTLNIAERRDKF